MARRDLLALVTFAVGVLAVAAVLIHNASTPTTRSLKTPPATQPALQSADPKMSAQCSNEPNRPPSCTQGSYQVSAPPINQPCDSQGGMWQQSNETDSYSVDCVHPRPAGPPAPPAPSPTGVVSCSLATCHQDGQEVAAIGAMDSCGAGKSWTPAGTNETTSFYKCEPGPGYTVP